MSVGDNSSVSAGRDITGSIIQTGDHNRATLHAVQLPPAESVDIRSAVEALRAELLALDVPERGKLERALADAGEEAEKPEPDKEELAGGLGRALGYAKKAADFSEHAGKVADLVTRIGGWLGAASPYAAPLLAALGLCAA